MQKNIAAAVADILKPVIEAEGFELWDVEYLKEGSRMILRVTIDKSGGVNIDDCEKVNRAIDPILDEADPIPNSYYLEVSSPGLERELRTAEHIEKNIGETVKVRFFAPIDGQKEALGKLDAYDGKNGTVTVGGIEYPKNKIAKINIYCEF